jgi:hypothetical protein
MELSDTMRALLDGYTLADLCKRARDGHDMSSHKGPLT